MSMRFPSENIAVLGDQAFHTRPINHNLNCEEPKNRPHFSEIGAIILFLTIGVKGELSVISVLEGNLIDVNLI